MAQPAEVQQWLTLQDGLDKLYRGSAPMPTPGPDEVLVEIRALSLNYRDTEVIMGLYNHHKTIAPPPPEPLVPCSDICGVVVGVGPGPRRVEWAVGDRVLSIFNQTHLTGQIQAEDLASGLGKPLPGCLQTHRVFPTTGLVRAPEHLSDEEASCLPIAAVTAWMSINGMRPMCETVSPGETVLLQGTGGVSVSGLQIAKASGAKAIITSSSDAKLAKAKAMGADHVINYRTTPEWQEAVLSATGGRGADVILECGGAGTLPRSFDAVAFGGMIACIGYLAGKYDSDSDDGTERLNVNLLALRRNVTLKGILNGPRDRFEDMCAFYARHGIRPAVDRVFAFEEAAEALEYLFSGSHFGKVVVRVK